MDNSHNFYSQAPVDVHNYYANNNISNVQHLTPYNYPINSFPFMPLTSQHLISEEVKDHQKQVLSSYTERNESISSETSTSAPATPPNYKVSCIYPTPPEDEKSSSNIQFDLNNTDSSDYSSNIKNATISSEIQSSSAGRSKRRSRTQYTKQQIDSLESIFLKSHYPEVHVVDKLSDKLGLSIERISVWFQNRRAKFKKTKKTQNGSESTFKIQETSQEYSNTTSPISNIPNNRNSELVETEIWVMHIPHILNITSLVITVFSNILVSGTNHPYII